MVSVRRRTGARFELGDPCLGDQFEVVVVKQVMMVVTQQHEISH